MSDSGKKMRKQKIFLFYFFIVSLKAIQLIKHVVFYSLVLKTIFFLWLVTVELDLAPKRVDNTLE